MAGAELQANAIDTLLRGAPLRSAPGWVDAVLVAMAGLLVSTLAVGLGIRALLAVPVALLAVAGGAQAAFVEGAVIAVAAPVAALVLGSAVTGAILALTEQRQRRALRATFARFVPEAIVDAVAARAAADAGLPSEELDATVIFCDLRGFTTYAQERSPATVLATLNRYLAEVTDAVLGHGGTVVAYLGDGVMSVFGAPLAAPDHADRALAAAREIAGERLVRLNRWLAEQGDDARFRLGVGMHSGPVLSGTVGSQRRLEYAAVGDTTNVAARVQALTKDWHAPVLATSATVERLSTRDGLARLGETTLRGRERPVELWTMG